MHLYPEDVPVLIVSLLVQAPPFLPVTNFSNAMQKNE
jgi:hypothetical protein